MTRLKTVTGQIGVWILSYGGIAFLVATGATHPDAAASTAGGVMERGVTVGDLMSLFGFAITAGAVIWRGGKLDAKLQNIEDAVGRLEVFRSEINEEKARSISDRSRLNAEVESICGRLERVETRQDAIVGGMKSGGRQP